MAKEPVLQIRITDNLAFLLVVFWVSHRILAQKAWNNCLLWKKKNPTKPIYDIGALKCRKFTFWLKNNVTNFFSIGACTIRYFTLVQIQVQIWNGPDITPWNLSKEIFQDKNEQI